MFVGVLSMIHCCGLYFFIVLFSLKLNVVGEIIISNYTFIRSLVLTFPETGVSREDEGLFGFFFFLS